MKAFWRPFCFEELTIYKEFIILNQTPNSPKLYVMKRKYLWNLDKTSLYAYTCHFTFYTLHMSARMRSFGTVGICVNVRTSICFSFLESAVLIFLENST